MCVHTGGSVHERERGRERERVYVIYCLCLFTLLVTAIYVLPGRINTLDS